MAVFQLSRLTWIPLTPWLPHRQLILVGDGGFSALELLHDVSQTPHAHLITRLRLDAEWWTPAPERKPHPHGRPRLKGARRPSPKPRLDDPHTLWRTLEVDPLLWPWKARRGDRHGDLRVVPIRLPTALETLALGARPARPL